MEIYSGGVSKMKNALIKKSLLTVLIGVLVCAGFLAAAFLSDDDIRGYIFAPDYETMSVEKAEKMVVDGEYFYADDLVKLDMYYVLDYFANDSYGVYYFVPVKEKNYMAVYVANEFVPMFEEIYEATWYTDGPMPDWDGRNSRGGLYHLTEGEMQSFLHFFEGYEEYWFDEGVTDITPYIEPYLYCYTPTYNWYDDGDKAYVIIISAIGIIAFILSVIVAFTYFPSFRKKLRREGYDFDDVDADISNAEKIGGGALLGNRYLTIAGSDIMRVNEIVWIFKYTHTTQHTLYGIIKTGKTIEYGAKIADANGKLMQIMTGASEEKAHELIDTIARRMTDGYVGYNEGVAAQFTQNRQQFLESIRGRGVSRVGE